MIKIIDDDISDFLNFLDTQYGLEQEVFIHICEGFDSVQCPDDESNVFGVFHNTTDDIYVAGDLPKEQVLKTVAHEYKHFLQKYSNESYNEEDAEDFADMVYNEFKNKSN